MTNEDALLALRTFQITSEQKLRRGLGRRDQMNRALAAGKTVNTSRSRWMLEVSPKLQKVLEEEAERFKREHPDDRLSNLDLADVLEFASKKL